jgi:hypothetical protein
MIGTLRKWRLVLLKRSAIRQIRKHAEATEDRAQRLFIETQLKAQELLEKYRVPGLMRAAKSHYHNYFDRPPRHLLTGSELESRERMLRNLLILRNKQEEFSFTLEQALAVTQALALLALLRDTFIHAGVSRRTARKLVRNWHVR